MITRLPRAVPAPPGKPVREEAARGQERARRLALRPGTWTGAEAAGMRADFDEAAAAWNGDRGGYRLPVLADALARGGQAVTGCPCSPTRWRAAGRFPLGVPWRSCPAPDC
ncbi:MAG TPA: hypothetical protein VK817_07985 [Trebonia sp.]|jgi:hypothetical protein|nr:hypothetical protein [Trebonia sp.]